MKSLRHVLLLVLMLLGLGCAYKKPVVLLPSAATPRPIDDAYVILVLMDGGRPQEIEHLVSQGRLPTIQELFFDQGARYQDSLTVLPSVSMPSHQAYISGLFPGHQGIPNLDWFSRPLAHHFDYLSAEGILDTSRFLFNFKQVQQGRIASDEPQLIFHDLKGYPTMAVFQTIHDGATIVHPSKIPLWTAYYGKLGRFYEELDFESARYALKEFRKLPEEKLPRFTYLVFSSMDLNSHFSGSTSERVANLYEYYDRFFAELRETLKRRGIWEKTTIIAVSDHGQHALTKWTDQLAILRRIGLQYDPPDPRDREVVWGDHGTALSNLVFKIGKDWSRRPRLEDLRNYTLKSGKKVDLIEAFVSEPDIELVVVPEGPWKRHLYAKGKEAVVLKRLVDGKLSYAYQSLTPEDPLGYLEDPEIRRWAQTGAFHDAEAWLAHTHAFERPDAVVLLAQLFADYRLGDMMLFTVKESHFKEDRPSSHGSMYAEDLRTIMMLHGPRIKPGLYPYMRSVDLYPAMLHLFGLEPSNPIDGVLRPELFRETATARVQPPDYRNFSGSKEGSSLTMQGFEDYLEAKAMDKKASGEQRSKARQLMDSIRAYREDLQRYPMP